MAVKQVEVQKRGRCLATERAIQMKLIYDVEWYKHPHISDLCPDTFQGIYLLDYHR